MIDFATQLLLLMLGVFLVLNFDTLIDNVHWGVAPTWSDFFLSITVAMISYTGIETISNMAEEVARAPPPDPAFDALRGAGGDGDLRRAAGRRAVGDAGHGDRLRGFTTALADTVRGRPDPRRRRQHGPGRRSRRRWSTTSASSPATILLIASNAGIIGVSRLTYSMGQHQQLPDRLRRISPRFRTPAIGIAVFGLIACIVMLPGQEEFLGTLYAFGAMLSFTIAHVSLIGLRWRLARSRMRRLPGDVEVESEEAWYRAPFNVRIRGVDVPLFAVIGGLGTFAAWIAVMALYSDALIVGSIWLLLGLVSYYVYRRSKGLSLTETSKVELPTPVGVGPVEYAGVLVAFEEGTYSASAIATALKLASHKKGDVRVIVTIDRSAAPRHRRAAARGGGDRAGDHRGGAPVGGPRPADQGPDREGARGGGRTPDRPRGARGARRRDRDVDAPPPAGRQAAQQDARDGARQAPLPGDHRLRAGLRPFSATARVRPA